MAASKLGQSPKPQQDKPDQPTQAATEVQQATSSTAQQTSPQQATISSPEEKSKRTSTEAQTDDEPEIMAEMERQEALKRQAEEEKTRRDVELLVQFDPASPNPEPKNSKKGKR